MRSVDRIRLRGENVRVDGERLRRFHLGPNGNARHDNFTALRQLKRAGVDAADHRKDWSRALFEIPGLNLTMTSPRTMRGVPIAAVLRIRARRKE